MRVSIQWKNGHKVVNLNRRKAIRERCLNCVAWSPKEVLACESPDCPLWPFRSGQGKQDAQKRARAIRAYCLECVAGQRAEIARCTCRDCPLFAYRRMQVDRSVEIAPSRSEKAIYGPELKPKQKTGARGRGIGI